MLQRNNDIGVKTQNSPPMRHVPDINQSFSSINLPPYSLHKTEKRSESVLDERMGNIHHTKLSKKFLKEN